MEKAVLKTLIYADIFDYPLTVYELHKWLIGRKATLRQVEKALESLRVKGKAERVKDYYCLSKRKSLVSKRKRREKQSRLYLRKAKALTTILKLIPWIKLVGVSGGLAMENAEKGDDIDLVIITAKNRLWIARLLTLGLLSLTGQRRKQGERGRKIAGKLCVNILLEEDKLGQSGKDIYLAHEVLQMKVLWQRNGIYQKYLEDNDWVFKFLPNWVISNGKWKIENGKLKTKNNSQFVFQTAFGRTILNSQFSWLEKLAKWFQLKIMAKPKGMERIEDGALYFHPDDVRQKVLKLYAKRYELYANS